MTLRESVGERLLERLRHHVEHEGGLLREYERLAGQHDDEFARYVISLILEDERRHHTILQELANAVESRVGGREVGPAVPSAARPTRPSASLLEVTRRLLAHEESTQREMSVLRRELKGTRGTEGLWALLLDVIRRDSEKHEQMLRFVLGMGED